ncbi:hypothetical protein ACFSR6_06395 [Pedobacter vanadiisoli]|uniref:Lipoprotein n=1 Tax=Pedobacter vanadiisoli TaxID=1761975 RepID=A0ABW5MI42_9SPHI
MNKLLLLVIIILFIFGCSEKVKLYEQPKFIRYSSTFRDYISDGSVNNSVIFNDIVYYKDCTLYSIPSISYILKKHYTKRDTVINELLLAKDTSYTYYLIKNLAKTGICYKSLTSVQGIKFERDSLMIAMNLDSNNLKIFSLNLGHPYKTTIKEKQELEVFLDKSEYSTDTVYRYFDKNLAEIQFSFAPSLDKEKGSKLYKTRFVQFHHKKHDKNLTFVERTDIIEEFKLMKISNEKPIKELFDRFLKESLEK